MRGFKLLAISVLSVAALLAAACNNNSEPAIADATSVGGDSSTTTDDGGTTGDAGTVEGLNAANGNFAVLISDEENAIGDFVHLWVEIDRVGVLNTDTGERVEIEVPEETQAVDLTQFTGDDATSLVQSSLPDGEYGKIFVHVEDVEGELVGAARSPSSCRRPSSS
jgi:hypothetical protein